MKKLKILSWTLIALGWIGIILQWTKVIEINNYTVFTIVGIFIVSVIILNKSQPKPKEEFKLMKIKGRWD